MNEKEEKIAKIESEIERLEITVGRMIELANKTRAGSATVTTELKKHQGWKVILKVIQKEA